MEIEELIQQGRALKNVLQERRGSWGTYYVHPDQDAYEKWLMLTKRYINTAFSGDKCIEEFEKLAEKSPYPTQLSKMLGILEAMKQLPQVVAVKSENTNPMVTITNTQTQSQSQNVFLNVFIDALHEELSRKQIRELKEIAEDTEIGTEEKKSSILDKIKEFGKDTLASIVANVLTNPAIWGMM